MSLLFCYSLPAGHLSRVCAKGCGFAERKKERTGERERGREIEKERRNDRKRERQIDRQIERKESAER